ncbi:hypothetical protein ACH5RR_032899 [Cinchona calisaya]|uniref:Uncharacterized protein n=1 Tax=Cinchona calisaya TaxID=153742 RepID=A0ABD2YML6_9GENT
MSSKVFLTLCTLVLLYFAKEVPLAPKQPVGLSDYALLLDNHEEIDFDLSKSEAQRPPKYQVPTKRGGKKNETQLVAFPIGAILKPFDWKKFASDERSTSAGDCDSGKCWKHMMSNRSPQGVATNPAERVLNAEKMFTAILSSNQTLDAIGDQIGSIHFIAEGATLDETKSSDNTISGPRQFGLVARNLGKPFDLTPL